MSNQIPKPVGRGAGQNPTSRFFKETHEIDLDELERARLEGEIPGRIATQVFPDSTRSIVTENTSPDIGFQYSINPYRGCEHGCAYCYARPKHEYLGLSAGLDSESKIFVKENAAELLREHLMKKSWKGEPIFFSGITDCYQPLERKHELTRGCLKVLSDFENPFGIISKNALVTRRA